MRASEALPLLIEQHSDLWHHYRQACSESLYFFTKAVWMQIPAARNKMSLRTHLPLCLAVEDSSIKNLLVEYPRKHLKSSIATVAASAHRLVQRVVRGEDPCDRFVFYSSSSRNAQRHWWDVKEGFERNALFQHLFPELIPDFVNDKWNEFMGRVPRAYNPKEPTFDILGVSKSTGRHYDRIIMDDMVDEENYDSESAIEKVIVFFGNAGNLLDANATEGEGRQIVVGNRWTLNDLNHYIHKEVQDFAILSMDAETGPKLSGEYQCRNLPPNVTDLLKRMEHGILWPELFSFERQPGKESLNSLLQKLKIRHYGPQYRNDPIDPEATEWKMAWLKRARVVEREIDGEKTPCVLFGDDPQPVPFSSLNFYVTWDPALDGKYSTSENAVLVTAMDPKGRVAVIREDARKCDYKVALDRFLLFCRIYGKWLKASGVEEVLFQRVLKDILRERADDRNVYLRLRKIKTPTGQSKDQRIRFSVGNYFEQGRVFVTDGCSKFTQQYAHFGIEGAMRDLIDAFGTASQLWGKPPVVREQDDEDLEAEKVGYDLGVTGYGRSLAS